MAHVSIMEPFSGRKFWEVLAYVVGIFCLCIIFAVTHSSLHGSETPILTTGIALWALMPVLAIYIARSIKVLESAKVDRFCAVYVLTLLTLLLPQISYSFRNWQYDIKNLMGSYADLYSFAVALICFLIAMVYAVIVHPVATWYVKIVYGVFTACAVLVLFLVG